MPMLSAVSHESGVAVKICGMIATSMMAAMSWNRAIPTAIFAPEVPLRPNSWKDFSATAGEDSPIMAPTVREWLMSMPVA